MDMQAKRVRNAKLVEDRLSGLSRDELAVKYGLTLAGVKSILLDAKVVLPPAVRQSNAYRAKLAKNPDAMASMRRSLTPEVVARRSASIQKRYSEDPELVALKTRQNQEYWANQEPTSKYNWDQVKVVAQSLGMSVVGDFNGPMTEESVPVRCHCGVVFAPRAFDLLYGKIHSCGCVKSGPQMEITRRLQESGLVISTNDRTVLLGQKELDIWIPDQKVGIEYCGLHWHGDRWGKSRTRHLDKLEACEALGFRLITIFSDEWHRAPAAVMGYLESILGLTRTKLGARELDRCEVEAPEAQEFWDRNHIQGKTASPFTVGLRTEAGKLVAAIGFKLREEGVWELVRYALTPGTMVVGGFERLWRGFLKAKNPQVVVTFGDRRWSQGKTYERHGFKKAAVLPPSYSYFKLNTDHPRFHKSNFRKDKLGVGDETTEWAEVQRLGYDRIWDCGLVRWEWKA